MIKLSELPELLTLSEVSELFRISKLTLKRWGKAGKIKFIRINSRGDRRYYKQDIINYINSNHGFLNK